MDDSTATTAAIALAATGVAGMVAVLVLAQQCRSKPQEAPKESSPKAARKKKKNKQSKVKNAEERAADKALAMAAAFAADDDDEDGPPPVVVGRPISKKKKRSHKGRKRRGSKKAAAKNGTSAASTPAEPLDEDDYDGEWTTTSSYTKPKNTRKKDKEADSAATPKSKKKSLSAFAVTIDLGDSVRSVIGRKGAVINNIKFVSGADINIPSAGQIATIDGTAEQVVKAKEMIEEVISSRALGRSGSDTRHAFSDSVDIDLALVGKVIGKRGANVQRIQDETGASVTVKRETTPPSIEVTGPSADSVASAVAEIQAIIDEGDAGGMRRDRPEAGPKDVIEDLSRREVLAVIGKAGSTINRIEAETGARLSVSKDKNTLTISGTDEQRAAAGAMVTEVLNSSKRLSATVECTTENVGRVIGSGGRTIRSIESETGCRLNVDRSEAPKISIHVSGSDKASLAAAKERIQKALSETNYTRGSGGRGTVKDGETEVVIELGNAAGAVIGRGGSTITSIESESGARLIVNKKSAAGDTCRIIGAARAVEQARKAVQEILDKQPKDTKSSGGGAAVPEVTAADFEADGDDGEMVTGGEGW